MAIELTPEQQEFKSKMGRPTKYSKALAKDLPYLFCEGASIIEVCAQIGIAESTFHLWIKKYPDFSESYKKGLAFSQAWWELLGRKGSNCEAKINAISWIFNMKNRFNWQDKTEQTLEVKELPPLIFNAPDGWKPEYMRKAEEESQKGENPET